MATKKYTKVMSDDQGKKRNIMLIHANTLENIFSIISKKKFLLVLLVPRRLINSEFAIKAMKAGADYIICLGKEAIITKESFDFSYAVYVSGNITKYKLEDMPLTIAFKKKPISDIFSFALNEADDLAEKTYKNIAIVIYKKRLYYKNWKNYLETVEYDDLY